MTVMVETDQVIELQRSVDSLTAANDGLVGLVSNLESMVTELLETQRKTMALVGAISDEIVPVIDQIASSPVGKMLGVKKEKKEKDND